MEYFKDGQNVTSTFRSEIDNWIPVDTTFYLSGDYFNSKNFYEDHITDSIAGEW